MDTQIAPESSSVSSLIDWIYRLTLSEHDRNDRFLPSLRSASDVDSALTELEQD